MCTPNGATAPDIYENIDNVITQNQIPWDKFVTFSVDKVSVNMIKGNSIKSRVLVKTLTCTLFAVLAIWHITGENPDVYFVCCPCYMAHNW